MMNLFSSFDPTSNFNLSLNWSSALIGLLMIPSFYWMIPSRLNMLWLKIIITLHKEFKIIMNKNSQGGTLIFISLFTFIMMNNFIGLFPYIFTSTSHMTMTLSMALPLWLSFMLYGWFNYTMHMLAHSVPQGTPGILMPFMVCIETISNIIRPGTLAIRLSANMIAGHLLLTLLGNTGSSLTLIMINILLIIQVLLLLLESAVSIIQAYVFVVLSALYSSETN
uniref:ATP synthase subunit a n=1 Tax=Plagiodera versicolora TaxID=154017 RepID=A0A7H0R0E2_PLAVC|nr:ATP synthase F0 subunit 6 [Plagiodera versicolora]QNQ64891.1 ATP synthase F0 subunit 6 [Plagiodera versicolora]